MKIFSKLMAVVLTLAMLTVSAGALTLEQAKEILQTYYVDGVPERVLEQDSIESMLEALGDPYTEYFDAATYAAFLDSMKDFVSYGIGATMYIGEDGLTVASVEPGLGAAKAGIQPGDIITAVDGQATAGVEPDTLMTWIYGEEGTKVKITVLHGGTTHTYTITRVETVTPATTTDLLDGHIGYIACDTFGPETLGHFTEGIEQYDAAADRWVVDLRNNGGGDVDAAVQTAGAFAGNGILAYLRDNQGRYVAFPREDGNLTRDPIIVVTSPYTASASETFASIIRDTQAGLVVGDRTYGKGVAQIMLDSEVEPTYFEDGSALKVTAYRVFSPEGATSDKVGAIPHLLVDPYKAGDVACLLSGAGPKGNTSNKLRLDMGWRWYVDMNFTQVEELRPAFTELLEAVPESATLWLGTGGPEGWEQVTAAQVAQRYALTDYTPRAFTDTAASPYAAEISALATYKIVAGPGDGTFQPETKLTRGQLCALLAQALRYTSSHTGTFADVPANAYYASAVEAMYAAGLVTGGSDGLFHPDDPIDHQQYMAVLARVAQRLSLNFDAAMLEDHSEMLEHEMLKPYDKWARESVWLLDGSQVNPIGQDVSMLWESLSSIDPSAPTTRGEAAAGLCNVLSFSGILPG